MKKNVSLILVAVCAVMLVLWLTRDNVVEAQGQNVPIGGVIAWAGPQVKIPSGYLECDGRELPRLGTYNALFNQIDTTWGTSTPSTFKIPDLRGYFLRGVDDGAARDPDVNQRRPLGTGGTNSAGSVQDDAIKKHIHPFSVFDNGHSGNGNPGQDFPRNEKATGTGENPGGRDETRPKNVYVYYIIRAL